MVVHVCNNCGFKTEIPYPYEKSRMDPLYILAIIKSNRWIVNGFANIHPAQHIDTCVYIALTCPKCGQREFVGAQHRRGWAINKTPIKTLNDLIEILNNTCRFCGLKKDKDKKFCPQCGELYLVIEDYPVV